MTFGLPRNATAPRPLRYPVERHRVAVAGRGEMAGERANR